MGWIQGDKDHQERSRALQLAGVIGRVRGGALGAEAVDGHVAIATRVAGPSIYRLVLQAQGILRQAVVSTLRFRLSKVIKQAMNFLCGAKSHRIHSSGTPSKQGITSKEGTLSAPGKPVTLPPVASKASCRRRQAIQLTLMALPFWRPSAAPRAALLRRLRSGYRSPAGVLAALTP